MYKPEYEHLTSGIHNYLGLCGKLINVHVSFVWNISQYLQCKL